MAVEYTEEHHVGVYKSKKENRFVKAKHPGYLIRNSLTSPSLMAAVLNAKYVNGIPFYRQEQEFTRYNIEITRREMAHWTILCAERYLSLLYDYLHNSLYNYHVLQADETPVVSSQVKHTFFRHKVHTFISILNQLFNIVPVTMNVFDK